MARVEMASQGWGLYIDAAGNGRPSLPVSITLAGTATAATHWSAVTGGTSDTASLLTDSEGRLDRFIAEGSYDLTVDGRTYRVEATAGATNVSLETRVTGLEGSIVGSGVAATPTGVAATDTATVLAAMQSGLPLTIGNYVCTAAGLNLAADIPIRLKGQGSARTTITFPSGANGTTGINFSGSVAGSTAYNLTVQADIEDTTLTVSGANAVSMGLVDGDYVHLWSSLLWPTTVAQGARQGEIVRVKSVNTGTGVITLYGRLDDTYLLADAARVRKLNLLDGCYIEGVKIVNSTPLSGASIMITASRTNNLRIRDLVCEDGDGAALQLNDSLNFDIDMKVRDLADDGANSRYGYGINLFGATAHGKVNIYAERCRHTVTTGASYSPGTYLTNPVFCGVPRHIDIYGEAHECTNAGWDSHSEGEDLRYWVASYGCQTGFQARAKNVVLMSYDGVSCADTNYIAWTASGFRAMPSSVSRTVTGNGVGWTIGSASGGTLDDVVFYGMHSTDDEGAAMQFQNCTNVRIIEPVVVNVGAGGGDCFYVGTGCVANSVVIVNPFADTAFRLVNNQSGVADAAHVYGTAALRNVSHIAQTTAEDGPMIARRTTPMTLVADGLTERLFAIRRDNYAGTRDTNDRLMMDSSGILWGGDGTNTPDTQFYRRAAAQWGMVGELRNVAAAQNSVVFSSRLAADTGQRLALDASGRLTLGDGVGGSAQMFSYATGNFQIDAPLAVASAHITRRQFVTATPYTVTAADSLVGVSVASAVALTLPAAVSGRELTIKDESGAANTNNITITPNGAETIDGAATKVINTARGYVKLYGRTSTGWLIIGSA